MTLKELLDVTSLSTRITVKKDEKILIDRELLSGIYYEGSIKSYLSETVERITAKQPYDIEITLKNKSVKEIKQEAYKDFVKKLKQHARKMKGFDFTDEFWDYAVPVETINSILKEMEDEIK